MPLSPTIGFNPCFLRTECPNIKLWLLYFVIIHTSLFFFILLNTKSLLLISMTGQSLDIGEPQGFTEEAIVLLICADASKYFLCSLNTEKYVSS